jgi:hypothetical protein
MSRETGEGEGPQLQIWENASRRLELGSLPVDGEDWEIHLVVERAASDLFRGRIAFRRGDEHLLTAPVVVEESDQDVERRARELPESMIRQFFLSVRS